MADFGVFAKSLITRLCEHFWRRGLRQKVVRSLHFKRILIRRSLDSRQGDFRGPEVELLFWQFSLGPPFAKSQKIADFGVFAKSLITRLCENFWRRGLRQKVFRSLHFKRILIRRSPEMRQGDFRGPEFELLFWQFSLGPPFGKSQKMADFGVFAKSLITRLCEDFWRRGLRQKVLRSLHFKRILIKRSPDWRQGDFRGPEFDLLFWQFTLGPPFAKSQKMADFRVFAKSLITRLCEHFWRRALRQKVFRSLHFKRILISRSPDWRQGDFRGPEVELLFWQFSLGPPFAKSQKMADFGVFAKSLITRLWEDFWRRSLRQKVLRSLHFKRILIKRSPDWRQGDFRGPEVELLFWQFSLGPPFAKSQKMADFGVFAKSLITRLCEHFWRRGLRQKVLRSLHFKRILIRRSLNMRQGDFRGPEFELFFGNFPLVPPLQNLRKWPIFVFLQNLS